MTKDLTYSIILILFFFSCNSKKNKESEEDDNLARIEQQENKTIVKTAIARYDKFDLELVSNGKVEATRKADINFEVADIVLDVKVKNGDYVRKGDVIAIVDDYKAKQSLEDAKLAYEKSVLDLHLEVLSEGHKSLEDTVLLSKQRLQNIYIKSGYASSKNALQKAEKEYNNVITRAPFNGVVADLEAKEFNQSSAYKSLCTLIDDSEMEVIFNVLETEIKNLTKGLEVEITPYANQNDVFKGKIVEVNPRIDENGMVKVKAVTKNKDSKLVDGMNVSVLIKKQIEDKIIIPKSSVLPRQGKKVVFTYEQGRAMWKYVTTGYENSTEISIEEGISQGDTVIYENNLGLSHRSEVFIEN